MNCEQINNMTLKNFPCLHCGEKELAKDSDDFIFCMHCMIVQGTLKNGVLRKLESLVK